MGKRKPMDPHQALDRVTAALEPAMSWTASASQMRRALDRAAKVLERYYADRDASATHPEGR